MKKTAMDCVKLARDPKRPHLCDFIKLMCGDFVELHGDRLVKDDRGLIGGFAKIGGEKVLILGHNKGATVEENMAANFGEGWLLPAEIANYAKNGINSVVSLQPFGCIANHIISKGMEKKIKQIYPDMNLLFLDFDAGTSEANVFNRLHFRLENAKSKMK